MTVTPPSPAAEVQVATANDNEVAVSRALRDADVSLDDLCTMARQGRFRDEDCRWAWIAISALVS